MKYDPPPRAASGFTLVDLLVSGILFLTIVGAIGLATSRVLALFETAPAENDIDSRAGRACDRLARELIGASARSITPALGTSGGGTVLWSSSIDHRVAARWEGDAVVWAERQRIAWEREPGETDNGRDDDGDGLVDEGMIVRSVDGPAGRTVLVDGVAELLEGEQANGVDDNDNGMIDESGLCFELADGKLGIHVTLEVRGHTGEILRRTQEASVWLRNTDS